MTFKHFAPVLACTLLLGSASPVALPPQPILAQVGRSAWRTFQPSGGRFSILMPGDPVPLGTAFSVAGKELQLQQFVSSQQNDQVIYMAGWIDLPGKNIQGAAIERSLDTMRDGFRNNLNARLLHEFPLTLGGARGRHFKMQAQIDNRRYLVTQRLYVRGNRLFQITAMVPQTMESSLQGSVIGFLRSFKFA